jgi:type IX secretion system PorP/SprF family membrane protein
MTSKLLKILNFALLKIFLLIPVLSIGQDIHFSQYDNAPLYLNPALTGLYNGNFRFTSSVRDQWFTVPIPYMTFSSSFDAHLLPQKIKKNVLSLGTVFHYDRAGDSKLGTTHILVNLAYHQQISKGFFLGAGIQSGFGHRRFRRDLMTFDDQFNGDIYNPNIVSADLANLNNTSLSFFDIGAGLNLRYQKKSRKWINIGLSMVHLNNPSQSFLAQNVQLKPRFSLHSNANFEMNKKWDVLPTLMLQFQNTYSEFLSGIIFKYHLNRNLGRETAFYLGSSYRFKDAVVPVFGLNYQDWQFGLSYDINISRFNVATNFNGAFELSVIKIWKPVSKLQKIKSCPIL